VLLALLVGVGAGPRQSDFGLCCPWFGYPTWFLYLATIAAFDLLFFLHAQNQAPLR
jgi:hypothetical protein